MKAVIEEVDQPLMLFSRSSISKTPIRLANPPGLIDPTYRGEIKVALDNTSDDDYTISTGLKLVQAVGFHGGCIKKQIVEELDETTRGEGGFGSTDALTTGDSPKNDETDDIGDKNDAQTVSADG